MRRGTQPGERGASQGEQDRREGREARRGGTEARGGVGQARRGGGQANSQRVANGGGACSHLQHDVTMLMKCRQAVGVCGAELRLRSGTRVGWVQVGARHPIHKTIHTRVGLQELDWYGD